MIVPAEKLSDPETGPLIDPCGRVHTYLRISVTDRCNLRCAYCMPPEGIQWKPRNDILHFEEIVRLVRIFAKMGVTKARITGGEPLIRKNVEHLVADLSALEEIETVALTTNALLLKDRAAVLKAAGLTRLNISLDTLRPARFERITLRGGFFDVMAGIDAAREVGFHPLKLNVVVMGGVNDDELLDFVEYVKDKPINVRFIEFMPFAGNRWSHVGFVPYADMIKAVESRYTLIPKSSGLEASNVAKEFGIDGFLGTVGFITSMSDHFCATCNRVRLTADGSIKSCLHHAAEVGLRDALRAGASDEELAAMIRKAIMLKPQGHAPMEELANLENRTMIQIGG